jgi:hypothetical protein
MKVYLPRPGKAARLCLLAIALIVVCAPAANGQDTQPDSFDSIKPTPVITGSTAYFSRVTGGQWQDSPSISPLLLFPIGNKLLLEAKGASTETWAKNAQGDYAGNFTYGLAYAQLDFIASRYMTVTAGKFVTPFNIYSERLTPNWIRALQTGPLTSPVTSNGSLGGMVRGGFPVNGQSVNLTYAAYFSTNNTNHITATDRSSGGRLGFFLPGPRLEFGGSYQQVLQADRPHSAGAYVEWQPNPLPLTLRSEYVRSSGIKGSGYWIESVYRLSQIPYLKRLELAGRGQQFFAAPNLSAATIKKLGALGRDTNEGDAGLNYYFRSDVRASATYGRQFALGHDANLWVFGMTWRFVSPLLPSGGAQ